MRGNFSRVLLGVATAVLLSGVSVGATGIDDSIVSSARDSYVFMRYLQDDSVQIESTDGAVTLSGTVADEASKGLAQETVASLPGVKSVDNQLKLKSERPAENSDGWISMRVKSSLLYNRNVSGMNTQVFVTDGIVTLRGEASSQAQKDLAGEYARDINGVKDVKNEMTIAAMPSETKQTISDKIDDASITAQVKMALLFRHSTSAFKTRVTTNDGVVTLSGKTSSAAGKDLAAKVANDVNGVTTVINNMTIEKTL